MGTRVGHIAPGFGFLIIGLWHLFNHIKLYARNSKSYISSPWFPTARFKYLELLFIMAGSIASISMELFIGLERHQPLDPDGSIPSNHLHNFEHASISLVLFVYAAFAIILDRIGGKMQYGLTQLMAAVAFAQELFLFHLHSADHTGPEGQYHLLLQLVVLVSLVTTLMGIGMPKSFLVSFVRSTSIFFQGLWFIVMGCMLWTPSLIPKGCFMNDEDGRQVVRCSGDEALHRAKSLVNIEFSWFFVGVTVFAVSLYLFLDKIYSEKIEYFSLGKEEEEDQDVESDDDNDVESDDDNDVESQKKSVLGKAKSLIQVGKTFSPIDMER